MVTNVNIFSESEDLEVEKLIADICILNGNHIAWSDFRNYDLFGLATHYNTSMDSVCGPKRYEFVFKRFIVYWNFSGALLFESNTNSNLCKCSSQTSSVTHGQMSVIS